MWHWKTWLPDFYFYTKNRKDYKNYFNKLIMFPGDNHSPVFSRRLNFIGVFQKNAYKPRSLKKIGGRRRRRRKGKNKKKLKFDVILKVSSSRLASLLLSFIFSLVFWVKGGGERRGGRGIREITKYKPTAFFFL